MPRPSRPTVVTALLGFLLACGTACAQSATMPAAHQATSPWWQHAVIYEIYPRSFQDTNGDGVGDLNGITSRLGYLEKLGITAIWIAPMYPSPQVDFGYDISNYEAVDPQYGTLADMDRLIAAAKKHHIHVLLDMVLNHTSDKHPWFEESASSRTNPKADWYVWNSGKPDPTEGQAAGSHKGPNGWVVPPNNWSSLFQGSAWQWVPSRGQFYYHFFYKQQPDLNWNNPAVEKAMFDSMRFWLDRGVAGFRLDAITTLFEDPSNRDEKETGKLDPSGFPETETNLQSGLPEVHTVLQKLHTMVASYPGDRLLVGEIYTDNTKELLSWYGTPQKPELQLPMDTLLGFNGTIVNPEPNPSLNVEHFRRYLTDSVNDLEGRMPLLVFDNHDNTRSWDRLAPAGSSEAQKQAIARLIATMLYTSRDVALTYYGAEIGMVTTTPTRKEDVKDPIGITGWPKEKGRDGERTPMQWTAGAQAGFSTDPQTWLPIPASYDEVNVATEQANTDSLLRWNERILALRAEDPAVHHGSMTMVDQDNANVISYVRVAPNGHAVLVSMNLSAQPQTLSYDLSPAKLSFTHAHTLATDSNMPGDSGLQQITLAPYAAWVAELQ
jgi:alpha-glucosidase